MRAPKVMRKVATGTNLDFLSSHTHHCDVFHILQEVRAERKSVHLRPNLPYSTRTPVH
jgi:hypothetical protein